MNNGLLTIGEMSKICNLSKRTLRYYDVIGLIKPAYTNKENGYRFYEPYQVGRIYMVRQMQELGISLEDVSSCVKEKGAKISIKDFFVLINRRKIEIQEEMKALEKQKNEIGTYISQYDRIEEQLNHVDEEVHIKFFDRRYLISKRFVGKLNNQMFGRTYAEIGCILQKSDQSRCELLPQIGGYFYGERNNESCINDIGFFVDKKTKLDSFQQTEIEEGYYAIYRYVGEYKQIDKQYEILRKYLTGLNYSIKDFCLELYQLSVNITLNEREYITELQIPIILNNNP